MGDQKETYMAYFERAMNSSSSEVTHRPRRSRRTRKGRPSSSGSVFEEVFGPESHPGEYPPCPPLSPSTTSGGRSRRTREKRGAKSVGGSPSRSAGEGIDRVRRRAKSATMDSRRPTSASNSRGLDSGPSAKARNAGKHGDGQGKKAAKSVGGSPSRLAEIAPPFVSRRAKSVTVDSRKPTNASNGGSGERIKSDGSSLTRNAGKHGDSSQWKKVPKSVAGTPLRFADDNIDSRVVRRSKSGAMDFGKSISSSNGTPSIRETKSDGSALTRDAGKHGDGPRGKKAGKHSDGPREKKAAKSVGGSPSRVADNSIGSHIVGRRSQSVAIDSKKSTRTSNGVSDQKIKKDGSNTLTRNAGKRGDGLQGKMAPKSVAGTPRQFAGDGSIGFHVGVSPRRSRSATMKVEKPTSSSNWTVSPVKNGNNAKSAEDRKAEIVAADKTSEERKNEAKKRKKKIEHQRSNKKSPQARTPGKDTNAEKKSGKKGGRGGSQAASVVDPLPTSSDDDEPIGVGRKVARRMSAFLDDSSSDSDGEFVTKAVKKEELFEPQIADRPASRPKPRLRAAAALRVVNLAIKQEDQNDDIKPVIKEERREQNKEKVKKPVVEKKASVEAETDEDVSTLDYSSGEQYEPTSCEDTDDDEPPPNKRRRRYSRRRQY